MENHPFKYINTGLKMKNKFSYHAPLTTGGAPLKLWDSHGAFEESAMRQLCNTAQLHFIHHHVAGMPDVHYGQGATVGSVVATLGAIVPACVGVDIGCGMMAVKTTLKACDLPDNLHKIRCDIEAAVPHGRTNDGKPGDKGAWQEVPEHILKIWWINLADWYVNILEKHPQAKAQNTVHHLGTLGTGNHFIEICLDEEQNVWIMLHSGSRGPGNKIGMYFIEKAKREMEKYFIDKYIPDKDLAYLVEDSDIFNDYIGAVSWAQFYAKLNREIMMENVIKALKTNINKPFEIEDKAIDCHHNYISKEHHFNKNVWVTRKGAVRARKGDLGIIPGSMGTGSFIVEGLGNPESFHSCSHGAGRVMSRGQAKKLISLEDHAKAMVGIEARLDADILDESPAAYKPIGAVMDAQSDLVQIKTRLRQIINVKG